ncbi:hypothetical protein JI58_09550 [Marinosulfonomonas sp. PRT-SC04]|nr:hypothetical protein JI58_09550 [Marinosulfonomonas sp. PRT-SC04]
MSLSLTLAFVWVVVANISAMIPSKDNYWTRAYILIAVGVPLLGYVTYQHGPIWGGVFLAAGASMLRWALVHFGRSIKHRFSR